MRKATVGWPYPRRLDTFPEAKAQYIRLDVRVTSVTDKADTRRLFGLQWEEQETEKAGGKEGEGQELSVGDVFLITEWQGLTVSRIRTVSLLPEDYPTRGDSHNAFKI